MAMAPLFPIASWLEHLRCRKHLLRFSLSQTWFGHSPCPTISRIDTLWRGEGREKFSLLLYFCPLVTLAFFIPVLLYDLRHVILSIYCIQMLLCWTCNPQLDPIPNTNTEHTEKNKPKKFYFFQHVFLQKRMGSFRFLNTEI